MKQAIGVAILAAVFVGLFGVTASSGGIVHAAIVWGSALAVTAVIVLAIYLIVG